MPFTDSWATARIRAVQMLTLQPDSPMRLFRTLLIAFAKINDRIIAKQ